MKRRLLIAALSAVVFAVGMRWGTFAVGGSDSYCYAHQAERWASGRLQQPDPLALAAPWPDAAFSFAPAGHVPSATVAGAIVPICPPGLSMVMAPFLKLGGVGAIFLVVPLFGAWLVAATYVIGTRYSTAVGVASAVLTAAHPVFLFQLIQPMSDVPAAALWLTAVACATARSRRGLVAAGLATSGAILMRPNLLPLGLVIGGALLLRPGRSWKDRLLDGTAYAAASAPGCLAVALVQQQFYGSPLRSGYGSLEALFSVAHIAPNAQRYADWMTDTLSPLWILCVFAPFVRRGWNSWLLIALVAVNVAVYLPYQVFEEWWYLRFLLPSIPVVIVLTVACLALVTAKAGLLLQRGATPALSSPLWRVGAWTMSTLLVGVAVVFLVREARQRQVFDLARLESRFARAGAYVRDRLPPDAIVVTSWQSGSVRFYAGRETLVWDALDPAWLDRALLFMRARNRQPYLLLERWEEPIFRRRFAGSEIARLDWPPFAEIAAQVRVYRPEDRARYFSGANVRTDYAR